MAFVTVAEFRVPDGHVAFVASIHQALETPYAYDDCTFMLIYHGEEQPLWKPGKPEITPVSIALFEEETILLKCENNGLVTHYCDAEFTGYYYRRIGGEKGQRGVTTRIGLPAGRPVRV